MVAEVPTRPTVKILVTGAVLALVTTFIAPVPGFGQAHEYDLVIRNGRVLDGAGNPWVAADVAIRDGRFVRVGRVTGRGAREIDAAGRYVAPGFIDMMDQSGAVLLRNGLAENKLRMGVTTAIGGEGGIPSPPGVDGEVWATTGGSGRLHDYFAALEAEGISINFGTYYSETQTRRAVLGMQNREPDAAELRRMRALMREAMEAGALGMTTALIYPPSSYASTEELIEVAREAAAVGGIYASHIRDEGRGLVSAVSEAVAIGEGADIPVEIFHFKGAYEPGWGTLISEAVDTIRAARARGVEVAADLYPYTAGGTGLEATIPSWAHEGGRDSLLTRLADPSTRARLKREVETGSPGWWNIVEAAGGWDGVVLVNARNERNAHWENRSIAAISTETGRDPRDVAWDLVAEGEGRVMAIYHMMDEPDIQTALQEEWVSIGSDAGAAMTPGVTDGLGLPHPRSYGTFPRVLARFVRETGTLSLEEAVSRMTSWPATRMRLFDRGVIREGSRADVVIFDLNAVQDMATYEEPTEFPRGIDVVVVNGEVTIENGRHTGARSGMVLRGPGASMVGRARGTESASPVSRQVWQEVGARVAEFVEREMADKEIPAMSVSLVDGDDMVWARGFGYEDLSDSTRADATTVYRVGSVSKLFTDMAIMQLVEAGRVDLDVPVSTYLPDFRPEILYGRQPTLRQLMTHRSGLVREPPEGNYFDDGSPSLAATVRSLGQTALVYEPETRTKYSNAAIATVGYTLETLSGRPFAEALERAVLDPLGMDDSAFEPRPEIVDRLADALMWSWDGRRFDAPTFEMGMAPAGSMYSTVVDLASFMSMLFGKGVTADGIRILDEASLEEMWRPQFAAPGTTSGFGLGFALSRTESRRVVRHGGAIYGFATELVALPDDGLGVAATATLDGANTVTSRVTQAAVGWMLDARAGRPLRPAPRTTVAVPRVLADRVEGVYGAESDAIEVMEFGGRVYVEPARGGSRTELALLGGDTLIVDGPTGFGRTLVAGHDWVEWNGARLDRVPGAGPPPAAPERWRDLIGEYGWDHNTLYVLEKDQQLHALIEWFYLDPLSEVGPDHFAFPDFGLYHGEELHFERDPAGKVTAVVAASVRFPRREVGTEDGVTFRIEPVRPVSDLRTAALAASPPSERGDFLTSDLVEVTTLDPTIRLDVRYASTNNFMGEVFYDEPRAFLQRPAAAALVRAHRSLSEHGYGLLIHDAYRPWYVTKMFWDATPEDMKLFVADPASGSRHNRGAAVDLTLYDLATGEPVPMVSGYDEFSERAFPTYPGETERKRWHRELLREAMEAEGFEVYEWEWWHFDYADWRRYSIQNLTFDRVGR